MAFLARWAVAAVAVLAAAHVVEGVRYDGNPSLIAAALVLSLVNAVLKPVLMLLTLPALLVTFGLFTLVINALLFWLVGWLVKGFHVDGFGPAFLGALIVSAVSIVLNAFVWKEGRLVVHRGRL